MTTDLHPDIRSAADEARESVASLTPTERITALEHALEIERAALVEERDSLRARLADIESAMGAPKAKRAPREPRADKPEQTAEEQLGGAFLALATPRTVDELAKALGVSRAKATELAEDLVTDGRAVKVRAGRGWRFQRATAAEEKGAAQ